MSTLAQSVNGVMVAARPRAPASDRARFWLQAFILLQIACQIGLLFPSLGGFRVALRGAAFCGSLLLLLLPSGPGVRHPAQKLALLILAIVALETLHPGGNTAVSRVAQLGLYVAILAPLFWVARLPVTPAVFRRVLFILWGFHTLSAAVGVLQVYFPGRFQPNVSSVVTTGAWSEGLKITLASGERMWR